jgi:hypothetical protein
VRVVFSVGGWAMAAMILPLSHQMPTLGFGMGLVLGAEGGYGVCEFARKAFFPTFPTTALCSFRQSTRRYKSLAGLKIIAELRNS